LRRLGLALALASSLACLHPASSGTEPRRTGHPDDHEPGSSPLSGQELSREEALAARVQLPAALATVRELVAFGPRTGGTPSGERAAALVAARLTQFGLKVEVVEDPPMRAHVEKSWKVALDGRELASAWPWNFSPALPATTARMALQKGGGPEAATDPATDPKGAVVLMNGTLGRAARAALAKAGAVALLVDASADPNRYIDWAPINDLAHEPELTIPVFALSYHDGQRVREALAAGGAGPHRAAVELVSESFMGRPRTVIGTLDGAGSRRDEILIICAHGDSDSGGPGADDNASGVASLIEVARALAGAAAEGLLPASRPQVRFIVWGAEYHSSRAWIAAHASEMARVKAVINYDETGTGAERDAVYYEGNDVPWNERLLRTLEAVANDHAGRSGFPKSWTSNPALGGTDAYVFLPKLYQGDALTSEKIPSTTVFSGAWDRPTRVPQTAGWKSKGWPEEGDLFVDYSAYYHSSGDTPANTTEAEPWNMERCAKLVAVGVYRLMKEGAAEPPSGSPRR